MTVTVVVPTRVCNRYAHRCTHISCFLIAQYFNCPWRPQKQTPRSSFIMSTCAHAHTRIRLIPPPCAHAATHESFAQRRAWMWVLKVQTMIAYNLRVFLPRRHVHLYLSSHTNTCTRINTEELGTTDRLGASFECPNIDRVYSNRDPTTNLVSTVGCRPWADQVTHTYTLQVLWS